MLLIRYCFVFLCRINQHCRQCSSVTFVTPNNVKNICLFAFNFPQHLSQVSILVGKAIIRQYRKGLLQWGYVTTTANTYSITFPVSFSSACYSVAIAQYWEDGKTGAASYVTTLNAAPSKTTLNLATDSDKKGVFWIAIGK